MKMPHILLALAFVFIGSVQAGQGLFGEYFSEQRFETSAGVTVATRVDPVLNLDFTGNPQNPPTVFPAGIGNTDTISIRHTGEVLAPTTGDYIFATSSDDGSRLYVNGKLVVRGNWRDQGDTKLAGPAIRLIGGQRYAIRQLMYQGTGGAQDRLFWTPPGQAEAIIPTGNLFPAATTLQGGGLLVSSPAPAVLPATVNLTTDGDIDWIHWGLGGATGRNRKATGNEFIADYGQQGPAGAAVGAGVGTASFTWTDGATTGDVVNAVAATGGTSTLITQGNTQGDGFEVVAPADTTPRRLRVYIRSGGSPITVDAKISDFSANPVVQTLAANSEQVFTFIYRASRANQMIVVRTVTATGGNPAQLFAATVGNPVPTATPQAVTLAEDVPGGQAITLTGTDPEAQALTFNVTVPPANGTLTGTAPNVTYIPNVDFSGTDSFVFTVTDPSGLTSPGGTVTLTVTPSDDGPPSLVNDTATTSDNVPVTANVLANDTVRDAPFTVSLVGQPVNGTAVLNANNTITYTGRLSFVGTDIVTYQVTDFDGSVATATLTVTVTAIPPTITSPLTVNAIQGLLFTYKITATGTLPLTFTAAPLPSGTILVGDTITGFILPGSYAVTLSATNQAASDIKTLVINCIPQSPGADTDGDGFTDEFEIGVGSSPVDPNSTPFTVLLNGAGAIPPGIPPPGQLVTPDPFFVSSLSIKLDFRTSTSLTRDSISFKGTLPVPPNFSSAVQAAAASIGGITVVGVLDRKGAFTSADKRVKIKIGKTRTSLGGANAPITVATKGIFAGAFSDEGYTNTTITKAQGKVVLFVAAAAEYFSATVNTDYTGRTGKSGSAKKARR